MWLRDAAAFYTQTSLPANTHTQLTVKQTHTNTNSLSHILTCTVQSTQSCRATSLQGILGCLLCQVTGSRSRLRCRLTGSCCLGCIVVGDWWSLNTCRDEPEFIIKLLKRVLFHLQSHFQSLLTDAWTFNQKLRSFRVREVTLYPESTTFPCKILQKWDKSSHLNRKFHANFS